MSEGKHDEVVWTRETLASLIGSRGRAGPITKDTVAELLEVSESTVSRWMRGHAVPDESTRRRLRWLRRQRETWYLRASPFVVAMWRLGDPADEGELEAAIAKRCYFSELAYLPTGSPHVVKCRLTLAVGFGSFTLYVLGPHRREVELSHSAHEATGRPTLLFDRRIRPGPRRPRPALEKGSSVEFYLHYLV